MKKVGVKYCGGCNPSYERVEIVHRVQSRFNHLLQFARHDHPDIDGMIIMSGCQRVCAEQDLNRPVPHYSASGEDDFEGLMAWLKSLAVRGD